MLLPCPSMPQCCMNTGAHVSFWIVVFSAYTPRHSWIAKTCDSSVFSFIRNLHTAFHRGCINLQSHQQCKKGSLFATSSLAFTLYRFFDNGLSDKCEVILHCISYFIYLIISDPEHLFICLLAICVFSLDKCLFRPSTHLLSGLFVCFLY